MKLSVRSKHFNVDMVLNSKVSILIGNSGIGKTTAADYLLSRAPNISVKSTLDIQKLTSPIFENITKKIERYYRAQELELPDGKTADSRKKRDKMLNAYWKDARNIEFENTLLIIDDEDFVDSRDFACMFNNDKTNQFLIIDRVHLSEIGFSTDSVYTLKSEGANYYLVNYYDLDNSLKPQYDFYLVEGSGSDYCLFSKLLDNNVICPTYKDYDTTGGRTKLSKLLQYFEDFNFKSILCFIDICAFGANIAEFLDVCKKKHISVTFAPNYRSFEYFLLLSNFFSDDADAFYKEHYREFISEEATYESRLSQITRDMPLTISKSINEFEKCFIKPCACKSNLFCGLKAKSNEKKLLKYFSKPFSYLQNYSKLELRNHNLKQLDFFD